MAWPWRASRRLPLRGGACTLMPSMTKFVRLIFLLLSLAAGRLGAQVADPSPLLDPLAAAATAPGGWIVAERQADEALQNGFSATAATIYREILRVPALPAEVRHRIVLGQVTALLDTGDLAEAEKGLQAYDGPRNSAYRLRIGLIAASSRRISQAKTELAACKGEELSPADKGWWYLLQAMVADSENDTVRRNAAYELANAVAVSDLQRARIALSQEQARLRSGLLNETQVKTLRDNMDRFQGTRTGYDALRTYAAALAGLGRAPEAQALLQRQLAIMPASERNASDQLRLMLGLIAGDGSVAGQQAFRQLLRDGQKPETQRLALQLLARGAKTMAEREQLRHDLNEFIGAPVQPAIIEDMLLVRAQLALTDKLYAAADVDARTLLERYPKSTLLASALGVRLSVAWDSKRYRTAGEVIAQLRTLMGEGRERAELGVLLAEAFFRSGDYRNAADAYDAALRELPAVVPAGILIFQRVLADIRADQLAAAAKLLDGAAGSTGFDAVNRWQAEWNLVRAMQASGQTQAAYQRVNQLLQGATPGVSEELRIRLMWLRAKLSFDNDQPDTTLRLSDELLAMLKQGGQIEAALRTEVTGTTQLLRAQALLALNRERDGFAMLEKLRADFPTTKAAQYSYLVHAAYLTQKGDMAGAQGVLISFVDSKVYKNSEYAPLALYDAALNLERQGLDRQLREAYQRLEQLIRDYPQDDLVFYARLKQGDLLRKLNDFAAARQVYEYLVNNYAGHPDELLAELALADSLFAQGGNSVVNYESAATIFERLRDLPSAPVDLRVEAGFKWAYGLEKRGQAAKALEVFWSVIDGFLLDSTQAAKLGAKGRYWVTRSLLELGQMQEDAGNLDEAQRAYQLIVDNKLGGMAQAQAKLARYRANVGTKP